MKKSVRCATVCVNQNQAHKEADEMKWCKSGLHFTEKDRFMIQKIRNTPYHFPHVSVREAAKNLGLSEATLRRELKRGCAEGKYCMRLNNGPEIKWQYFPYYANKAIQDAREKASHKGPKMKLMDSHINTIKEYLVAWNSIPAAYAKMILEHPEIRFPCLRTFVYHAQNGEWRTTVGEIECFRPYDSRKIPDKPAEDAKNHSPTLRIDDLPAEVKSGECKKFAQMDTVHSGSKGSGGLLTMVLPTDKHQAFIRKLTDFRQETIHKARAVSGEGVTKQGIEIDHILTENGSEFLDEKIIGGIFGAKVYYTHAYAGWEKGAVENLDKRVRRFYPKGCDFSKVTRKQIQALQEKLTAYPPNPSQERSVKCVSSQPGPVTCVILLAFFTAAADCKQNREVF